MSFSHKNPINYSKLKTFCRTAYSPPTTLLITFPSVSPVTKQEFAAECDINTIMAKYQFNGEMPILNERAPQYLDCSDTFDYQEAMNKVAEAKTLFNELPSAIRNRFENNPAGFIDFCRDEKNRDELQELGLLSTAADYVRPLPAAAPPAAPAANPAAE